MSSLKIYSDGDTSTSVPNRFIDEYMIEANDAQIKVYLYLLRVFHAHRSTSISDIADKFNHTEKDVLRSLTYWEKKKLLSLEYDDDRNLPGVHSTLEQCLYHLPDLRSTPSVPSNTQDEICKRIESR